MRHRVVAPIALALALALASASAGARAALPLRIADADYWRLIQELSEPDGFFRSENLVSNEDTLQVVLPALEQRVRPGGVYVGVGPEQNFTYIAALQPKIAFIVDIRRGNLLSHLMYKALFELSADRADFLSRLFSRPRPEGLGPKSTAEELFSAFSRVESTEARYDANVLAIVNHLRIRKKFPLSDNDVAGMASIYQNFYMAGPWLAYANVGIGNRSRYPSYRDLQVATDGQGRNRAFLGNEEAFRSVKALEEKNLLVPVVGDFAGPKALRAVGAYVRTRGATVTTFYLSNVEQYLFDGAVWDSFAQNVAAMPIDETSTFIRSCFNGCQQTAPFPSRAVMLLDSMPDLLAAFADGRIRSYNDVLRRSR